MKSSIEEFKELINDYTKYEFKKEGKITPVMFCLWPDDEVVMLRLNPEAAFTQENKEKISNTMDELANHRNTKALALVFEVDLSNEKDKKINEGILIAFLTEDGMEKKLFGLNRQTRTVFAWDVKNNKFDADSRPSNFFDWNLN